MHKSFPGEGGKSNPGWRNSIKDGSEVRKKRQGRVPALPLLASQPLLKASVPTQPVSEVSYAPAGTGSRGKLASAEPGGGGAQQWRRPPQKTLLLLGLWGSGGPSPGGQWGPVKAARDAVPAACLPAAAPNWTLPALGQPPGGLGPPSPPPLTHPH